MTKISYIAGLHGEGHDEVKDRAALVQPAPYFNPLVMTEGGAYLRLMKDQVTMLSQYYPDKAQYQKGLDLINNALNAGVHGPTPFLGALDKSLYPIARAIDIYRTQRQPASRPVFRPEQINGSWRDESLVAGMRGEIPVPPDFALWWWQVDKAWFSKQTQLKNAQDVKKYIEFVSKSNIKMEPFQHYAEMRDKYDLLKYVVDKYNDTLVKFAHHPLYNFLPQNNSYPSEVITKNILHAAGVQGMANTGEFSLQNMTLWTRNSVMRANIDGNVGAISPEKTAFALTGLDESVYAAWIGVGGTAQSRPNVRGQAQVGILPAVAVAIIGLIGAAVAAASQFLTAVQNRKAAAFAGVAGWGTNAYSASETDWKNYQYGGGPGGPPVVEDTGSSNLPLILAAAGAGLLLLSDKK